MMKVREAEACSANESCWLWKRLVVVAAGPAPDMVAFAAAVRWAALPVVVQTAVEKT